MVATDTTISGSAGRISSASSRPAVSAKRDAQVHADEQRDGQVVGKRDERELHVWLPTVVV